jgi:hypothetical protein
MASPREREGRLEARILSSERAVSADGVVPTHHRGPSDGADTRKGWALATSFWVVVGLLLVALLVTLLLVRRQSRALPAPN